MDYAKGNREILGNESMFLMPWREGGDQHPAAERMRGIASLRFYRTAEEREGILKVELQVEPERVLPVLEAKVRVDAASPFAPAARTGAELSAFNPPMATTGFVVAAQGWLKDNGVLALWTNVAHKGAYEAQLKRAFTTVEVEDVTFENPLLEDQETNALYFARG
jgi:hypothetical protein